MDPGSLANQRLGLRIEPERAEGWQAILADAEALLDGRLLVPHPLLPPDMGINLAAWFDDPSSLNPIGWLHG